MIHEITSILNSDPKIREIVSEIQRMAVAARTLCWGEYLEYLNVTLFIPMEFYYATSDFSYTVFKWLPDNYPSLRIYEIPNSLQMRMIVTEKNFPVLAIKRGKVVRAISNNKEILEGVVLEVTHDKHIVTVGLKNQSLLGTTLNFFLTKTGDYLDLFNHWKLEIGELTLENFEL